MVNKKVPNRLINQKSPYLLQHAYNPVAWYPWSKEAFAKAKSEDKPIFLSIGYSTCHWCHVMEGESFEDEEVAEILNKYFISIKVDKEERPDIDSIYMAVCQAFTGSGGWPMTIIMTPDKKPFYAGTYFPKKSKYGRPGLMDILYSVHNAWITRREELVNSSESVIKVVNKFNTEYSKEKLDGNVFKKAYKELRDNFDPVFGGIGNEPKFPIPHNLIYLLRYNYSFNEKEALEIVEETLKGMYKGGIFDHIGFGFSRYSVDRKWLVPHFVKMLYDNALLSLAYTEAYQVTNKKLYKEISEKVFTYILRDMTSSEGGFYCAEDADSDGEEGKFYVWDKEEILKTVGEEDGNFFCKYYNISSAGNFEKKNIPNLISVNLDGIENDGEIREKLNSIIKILFQYREKRVHPHKDDKILTGWNGLMIASLAYGGRVYENDSYIKAAENAAEFIFRNLVREDGRLLARYREGEAAYLGYLEDYAFFVWGLIELYESTFKVKYLEKALELNKDMLKLFSDEKQGGLYLYGSDGERLIIRPKEIYDGALPSGNSTAALNLARLWVITEDYNLKDELERLFNYFSYTIRNNPSSHCVALMALMFSIIDSKKVSVEGNIENKKTNEFIEFINSKYLPLSLITLKDNDVEEEVEHNIPESRNNIKVNPAVFICENQTCGVPVTDLQELKSILK